MKPTIAILGIIACAVLGVGTWLAAGSPSLFSPIPKVAAAKPSFKEHCIGRVTYIQFENAVVTKLKPDGKVWTCGGA